MSVMQVVRIKYAKNKNKGNKNEKNKKICTLIKKTIYIYLLIFFVMS